MINSNLQQPYESQEDIHNRVRILEGRYNSTRDRLFLINDTIITHFKNMSSDIDSLNSEIKEIKQEMQALKETTSNLLNELNLFARKESIKVLEKYINLWNPLRFVTHEELEDLIKKRSKNVTRKRKRTVKQSSRTKKKRRK